MTTPVNIGDEITLVDDYTGEPFTYIYEGGPRRRFSCEKNAKAFYADHIDPDQTLDLLRFLVDQGVLGRDKEHPYLITIHAETKSLGGVEITKTHDATPQHLHNLLDALIPLKDKK